MSEHLRLNSKSVWAVTMNYPTKMSQTEVNNIWYRTRAWQWPESKMAWLFNKSYMFLCRWRFAGPDTCLFDPQISNTKFNKLNFHGKMGYANLRGIYSRQLVIGFWSELIYQSWALPIRLMNLVLPISWAQNKIKNQNRAVHFLSIFVFWALLLKIQTGTTLSILGVRGSSSNSREPSNIPFNDIPIET